MIKLLNSGCSNTKTLTFFSLFCVFFLSILIIFLDFENINNDGMLYISQTYFFINNEYEKAISLNPIYIYPLIASYISEIFQIKIIKSYYLLSIVFNLVTFFYFLKINLIMNVFKEKNLHIYLIISSLLIYVTNLYLFDEYLTMIIRDHGMWCFLMIGVFYSLQYIKMSHFRFFFYSILSFCLGSFFRPELLIYSLVPLVYFSYLNIRNYYPKHVNKIFISFILSVLIISFYFFSNFFSNIFSQIFINKLPLQISGQMWLVDLLNSHYIAFKLIFINSLILISAFKLVGPANIILLGLFTKYRSYLDQKLLIPTLIFICIALFIPVVHAMTTFVISSRYLVPLMFLILIITVHGLIYYLFQTKEHFEKLIKYLLLIILIVNFLNIIFDKKKINYYELTSRWVIENNIDKDKFYTNNEKIDYFLNLFRDKALTPEMALKKDFDYYAISFNSFYKIREFENLQVIKQFPNNNKPKIVIYKKIK